MRPVGHFIFQQRIRRPPYCAVAQGVNNHVLATLQPRATNINIRGRCPGMAHQLLRRIQAAFHKCYGGRFMPYGMETKWLYARPGAEH